MGSGLQHLVREAVIWSLALCAVAIGFYCISSVDSTFEQAAGQARAAIERHAVVSDNFQSNGY
jgi:hypothetical protein